MGRLDNKVAVITGAASGIGRACAKRFAREGARVVVADLKAKEGQAVAAELPAGLFVHTDVTDPVQVSALIDATTAHYGQIDIMVNNAGIEGSLVPLDQQRIEDWHQMLAVNLSGVFYGIRFAVAAMLKQEQGGVILNMASVAGVAGLKDTAPYSAAKAGVIQLTKVAALENARRRIRVNALCPGSVETEMMINAIAHSPDPEATRRWSETFNPIPGLIQPGDIASAALFLVSDEARFITGVALPVDGGYVAQ
ncbi:MAG: glucose 1-dehydrogenase [Roseiflexaceae bacterium]